MGKPEGAARHVQLMAGQNHSLALRIVQMRHFGRAFGKIIAPVDRAPCIALWQRVRLDRSALTA